MDKCAVDVGKLFETKIGAGQISIPKELFKRLPFKHKEKLKLKIEGKRLVVSPLGGGV
jgi:hypothetical protein